MYRPLMTFLGQYRLNINLGILEAHFKLERSNDDSHDLLVIW